MKWTVEFMGQRKPLTEIQSEELTRIVYPVISRVEAALAHAEPGELEGLQAIVFSESETAWGVRFEGSAIGR